MSRFALTAERVLYAGRLEAGAAVLVEGAGIENVFSKSELDGATPLRDLGAGILAPGFVDLQVNGGAGVLLNESPTVEGVRKIAQAHRRFGTTGLLPTVITDSTVVMRAAAQAVADAIKQGVPGILGIHIEGPFIDPKRKGAHPEQFIRKPTQDDIAWLCGLDCGRVLVTLAPNVVEPVTIRRLADAGIIVSLGHSDATYEQARAARAAGASGFTHLFNAMSQMSGRAPGMVGAALAGPAGMFGLIADGYHVDPAALKIAIAASPQGAFFVSDAMQSAAGGPQSFKLQGRAVDVVSGRLQLADGTLAGANITLLDAVRYAHRALELDLAKCLEYASASPAAFLGLQWTAQKQGRLMPGYRANLVHLSPELDVLETWIEGASSK